MKSSPPPASITRARHLRRDATGAERIMWRLLRENFPKARFRRQVPLLQYIADFASHRLHLVIEIDGGQHSPQADAARTGAIEGQGYRMIRFWNNEVLENPEGCMCLLDQAIGLAEHDL